MQRAIVWFSCGGASAIASKLAVKKYDNCEVVYCDTGGEHESNKQFLKDVEIWIDKEITILKSDKYKDHFDVFRKHKFLQNNRGFAYCTTNLKKKLKYYRSLLENITITSLFLKKCHNLLLTK